MLKPQAASWELSPRYLFSQNEVGFLSIFSSTWYSAVVCLCYEKNTDNTLMLGLLLSNVYSESGAVLVCHALLSSRCTRSSNQEEKTTVSRSCSLTGLGQRMALPAWTQRKFSHSRGRLGDEVTHNSEARKSSASGRSWPKGKLSLNHGISNMCLPDRRINASKIKI